MGRVGLRVGVDGPGQEVPRPTPASPQPVQAPLLQDTLRQGDNSCNMQTSYLGQKALLFCHPPFFMTILLLHFLGDKCFLVVVNFVFLDCVIFLTADLFIFS